MTRFKDRTGDFTKKKYLYKFYKNGYTSRNPKYITAGQYLGSSGVLNGFQNSGVFNQSGMYENNLVVDFQGAGSNANASGVYTISTDARRKLDLKDLIISFSHGHYISMYATVNNYKISLFDYEIARNIAAGTIVFSYKGVVIDSKTYSSSYAYLRMQEKNGVFYIERSSDGVTWTAWSNRTIDFDSDVLKSSLSLSLDFSMNGPDSVAAFLNNIEAVDRKSQLLAVESRALNDLEFTETINNPASATTIKFPYDPRNVPAHCDAGNFVEVYANFYDDGVIKNEPILDENSQSIRDENNEPIYGVVLHGNVPEQPQILKFSGYIGAVDYDYDEGTVSLTFVSHGEIASNSIVRSADEYYPIISQLSQNTSELTNNRRQTFTLTKMTKVDAVRLMVSHGGGGSSSVEIGRGTSVVLATSKSFVWSGGLGLGVLTYEMKESLYLEAGTYWIRETNGISWRYQSTNVMSGGSRQRNYIPGSGWQNEDDDAYFEILTKQPQLSVQLSGSSQRVAESIFEKSLALDYSPLYLDQVDLAGYEINISLSIDSAKNALNALYRQLPTGWFYHFDVGTGAVRIKNRNATPDHLLVFGRDFTEMKITKDIDGIINDVFYVGGELVEQELKLIVRSTDVDSIAEYRQGTSIVSNEKVTRYDTAQLLSNNTIANNNKPRLTTEITLSAAKYNTETVRIGDVVKIANGDRDVLGTTLVVADIDYSPAEITISLDSAPRNLSRTIDAINREIENMQTAGAGAVV